MKTDRELLELAAKAAGYTPEMVRPELGGALIDFGDSRVWWNPLTDDGDALRLAVKLGLIVDIDTANCATTVDYTAIEDFVLCECHGIDAFAATRRAIVRAAAEIGSTME